MNSRVCFASGRFIFYLENLVSRQKAVASNVEQVSIKLTLQYYDYYGQFHCKTSLRKKIICEKFKSFTHRLVINKDKRHTRNPSSI